MTYTLRADQVPEAAYISDNITLASAKTNQQSGPTNYQASRIGQALSGASQRAEDGLSESFNKNAMRTDLTGQRGGGGLGILTGLGLTIGTGLTVIVGAGQAMCRGILEIVDTGSNAPARTVTVIDAFTNWIWLKPDGSLAATHATLTPPATGSVLLGAAICSGGAVTSLDYSGVMYLINNHLLRNTADTVAPVDTPPAAMRFETQTLAGLWYWNGARYINLSRVRVSGFNIGVPGAGVVMQRYVTETAFTIPAGCPGAVGIAKTGATAAASCVLRRLPSGGGAAVNFGTMNYAIGAFSATFTAAADTVFAAGDAVEVVSPGSADATLADMAWTLPGALV